RAPVRALGQRPRRLGRARARTCPFLVACIAEHVRVAVGRGTLVARSAQQWRTRRALAFPGRVRFAGLDTYVPYEVVAEPFVTPASEIAYPNARPFLRSEAARGSAA